MIRIFHICIAWAQKPYVRRKPIRRLALLSQVFYIFYNDVRNIQKLPRYGNNMIYMQFIYILKPFWLILDFKIYLLI